MEQKRFSGNPNIFNSEMEKESQILQSGCLWACTESGEVTLYSLKRTRTKMNLALNICWSAMEAQQNGWAALNSFTGLLHKGYLMAINLSTDAAVQVQKCFRDYIGTYSYMNCNENVTMWKSLHSHNIWSEGSRLLAQCQNTYYEAETTMHSQCLKSKNSFSIWKQKLTAALPLQ